MISYMNDPSAHWSVTVPVAKGDQRVEYGTGRRLGTPFITETLSVTLSSGAVIYRLSGPNMKQDGRLGKLSVNNWVTRAHVQEKYPEALEALNEELVRLAGRIGERSVLACEQIGKVRRGE